ncbi:Gem-associated protein 4, partial [Takifugu flavidus]
SAILQGAFVLADKLCLPSTLSSIQKADWDRVGHPVLETLREICGNGEAGTHLTTEESWIKKLICVLWLKLLCKEDGEDREMAWRENPFFYLQSGLPKINHVVLFEVVKSLAAARTFSSLLLHLPLSQTCTEIEKLVQHVKSTPETEDDVQLFLDVWWEMWKSRVEDKKLDDIETIFAKQLACLNSTSSGLSPNAAKRLKLDDVATSLPTTDVLHRLLGALKDLKGHISSQDLCLQALSISLDALYTCFLIDQEVIIPPKERVQILSKIASIKEKNDEKLDSKLLKEAQRDLRASYTPSTFRPVMMTLREALNIVTELAQSWESRGLLKMSDGCKPSISAFKLEQSANRVLTALPGATAGLETEWTKLQRLLDSLSFPAVDTTPELHARVAAVIINHGLDNYRDIAALFASEESWAAGEEHWIECVEKNQAAFRQHGALRKLSSTLMSKLQSESMDVNHCRKLMKVIADIFSALPLNDKNQALADMVTLSSRGFFGSSIPSSVTKMFEQELNMAFNCIIQGGGASSAGATQQNLNTAVSLVARVAYQNPEAALRSCCHSAVFNKDAFTLMARILRQLPGLRGQERGAEAEGNDDGSHSGLLCGCLHEMIKAKSLSAGEKMQLLKFVELLMKPERVEEEERGPSFLPPREVVNTFVLPSLSPVGGRALDIELTLQFLDSALSVEFHQPDVAHHWVLECSPFPLLYVLAQLLDQTLRVWEQSPEDAAIQWSMETKELLVKVLKALGTVVGAEVAAAPSSWSRALFWLYNKTEELDWTVRFYLKPVWREHFKNEVPSSLLAVCDLPEQEWCGLDLSAYGQGTGLLAWMECCAISDSLQSTMMSSLSVDRGQLDHVIMFSKGLLVALTQTLPCCSLSEWTRLWSVLRELINTGCLHVPFSLEYVEYLPLLDLKGFSCELRQSVFMLRVFQLLCGSSCSHWLSADGWAHVGRLYSHAVREMMKMVRVKLPLPTPGSAAFPKTPASRESNPSSSPKMPQVYEKDDKDTQNSSLLIQDSQMEEEMVPSQEVLFVLSQLFCHVQHVQVMIPGGQCEPLFLSSLEILSHYEAIMAAFPDSSSPLESANTRRFFTTITDNLENLEMKAVLQQKISQLVSLAT